MARSMYGMQRQARERTVFEGHNEFVSSLAFSPDGKRIASVSSDLNGIGGRSASDVKMWNATTGEEQLSLHGHNKRVRHLAFSHDGNHIATAGYDGAIKVWNSRRRNQALTIQDGQHNHLGCCRQPRRSQSADGQPTDQGLGPING